MGVEGPVDRPPPPPHPDPPKGDFEAAAIVDEGGGAPADRVDVTPFQQAGTELATIFTESDWRAADQDARRVYVQEADGAIREAYGLGSRKPEWFHDGDAYGRFVTRTKMVGYGDVVVELDDPAEAIKTAAHENRHAYQWEVINGREPEPEVGRRDEWRQARKDYPTNPDPGAWTEDEEKQYWNNPLEIDARAAEVAVYNAYLEARQKGLG